MDIIIRMNKSEFEDYKKRALNAGFDEEDVDYFIRLDLSETNNIMDADVQVTVQMNSVIKEILDEL